MTLRQKILLRIYVLTFLIILAMSVTYYYLFTKDIRERSQQNVTMTFNLILDDLSSRINTIAPKVDRFVQTSLTSPMYTVQMVQTQQKPSEQESSVWYVKKVMTYFHTIASRMREFGTLVEAREILVYGAQRNLLVAYRHEGEAKTTAVYLPEIKNDRLVAIHPDDRWYATLQSLAEIPFQSLPEELPTVYHDDIPETPAVILSTLFPDLFTIQFSAPIVERGKVQGVCLIHLAIRQEDVDRYARLSGTEVNVFAGSAFSVGTLPEYNFIPGESTQTRQDINLLSVSEPLLNNFSDIKIRDRSYYQGVLAIGNRDTLVGAITVLFPRGLEEKQKKNFFLVVAGVTVVFSILAAAEAFGLSAAIVSPIARLMAVMKDVKAGNLDVEVPVESNDEIGKLADTFNTMTAQLKKYHEHLEELVEERTIKLQQEIAERRRAEEEVLLLKNAIETAKVGVTITDTNRKIIYVNPAEAIMHGYTVADLIGNDVRIFSPKEYWQDINFEQLEKYWTRESVNIRKDGTIFPVHSISTPVCNEVGNPVGIITVSEDITARKRAEEELQKAKEAALEAKHVAEVANKAKSEFLANMSHDIRTPMNAILGFSEILKEQLRDFPQYQRYLDRITNSGHNLLRLIDDILDLSKIEARQLKIQPETVNLHTIFNEIYHTFSLKAREKGIRFESYISPDTPAAVLLDGACLRRILVNLVGNAMKFTEEGRVSLRVSELHELHELSKTQKLKNSKTHVTLLFEVEDTGIGIPQENQQQVFDPFQQHTRSFGGTGLGLSITKRLVELMNGSISVESLVNKGSVFRVEFPEIRVAKIEEEILAEKDQEIRDILFHEATILLVDDNASNREVICGYLASQNLHLVEAENGQEAIQTLKQIRPDLILMDIRMPVMDGDQATQLIKADQALRTIPVVALTAYAMKDQREHFQTLYEAYLSKPVSREALIATLARFLSHTKVPYQGEQETVFPPLRGAQENIKSPLEGPVLSEVEGGRGGVKIPETRRRGILEDLKAYTAQTGPFPQAFLDKLHLELLPKHKEVSEVISVDDIIDFSEALITVGDAFIIPPLKHYGEELLRGIKVFDSVEVRRLLAQFPDIVEILTGR